MKKILIAVGNELERSSLRKTLKEWEGKIHIQEAANGTDAEKIISMTKPDIVLADLDMHNINGMSLEKKIKAKFKNDTPFFVMVYSIDKENPANSTYLNRNSYCLMKSYSKKELCCYIKELLNNDEDIEKKNKISHILTCYGITERLLGYEYLLRGIELVLEEVNLSEGLSKQIYYTLAQEFEKNYGSIERNIRYAIKKGHGESNASLPDELNILKEKHYTNFDFITTVAKYIRNS